MSLNRRLQGKRISLVHTSDPYTNLKPGDLGTIQFEDDIGQVHVKWDSGSNLALIPEVDRFIINPEEVCP